MKKMKTLKHVPVIKQLSQTECGLACCTMILNYYKSKESMNDLQRILDVGRDGMSIWQIKNFLISKGFIAKIYKVSNTEKLKESNIPFIAYWENKHFIIVEKFLKNKVIVNDPAYGRLNLSYDDFFEGFSKYAVVAFPSEKFSPQRKSNEHPWRYVFCQLTEKKILILVLLILMACTYYINIYIANITQKIVDKILIIPNMNTISKFIISIGLAMLLYIIFAILKVMKLLTFNVFLSRKLEGNTFEKLIKLPYNYFEQRGNGDILYKLSCANAIKELIVSQLITGIIDFGSVVFIMAYMFDKSCFMAMITLLIACVQFISLIILQPRLKEAIDMENIEKSKLYGIDVETITSIESIKMSAIEKEIFKNWNNVFNVVLDKFAKRMKYANYQSVVTEVIQIFAPSLVLICGIIMYLQNRITLGGIVAFQSIASMFFSLVASIFSSYTQFLITDSYAKRINEIWIAEVKKENGNVKNTLEGNIELKDVSFSYTKYSNLVLKNINMKIQKDQKVAIVGESGSGKSTLGKILVGLFEPTDGNLFYDGIEFNKYDKKSLLKQIGIVSQDGMLFNKSIAENIALNNTDISIEEVKEAAQIACIDKEINNMPMKYNTIISDLGQNLSGGQRQRILIARALLKKPKILVMDEATSSLDNVNEAKISNYLSNIGCTRVIIAHRLSTIIDADIIYVLNNGEIIAQGRHEYLLDNCEFYNKLYYSKQSSNKISYI